MHARNSIKCLLFSVFCFFIDAHLVSQEVVAPQNVLKVVDQYFGCASGNDIKITRLLEGHSTLNFSIELSSKRYVLRFNEKASLERFQCELFAMEEASKAGISPIVVQGFPHEKMVLMEYIDGNTMTIEQASQVETCIKIAQNLKKTHSAKKNPYHGFPRNEIMEGFYAELLDYPEIHIKTTQAIEIIRKCHNEIVSIPSYYAVNTHNDLNPGNILIEKERVLFIDWEGTNWEDPF